MRRDPLGFPVVLWLALPIGLALELAAALLRAVALLPLDVLSELRRRR